MNNHVTYCSINFNIACYITIVHPNDNGSSLLENTSNGLVIGVHNINRTAVSWIFFGKIIDILSFFQYVYHYNVEILGRMITAQLLIIQSTSIKMNKIDNHNKNNAYIFIWKRIAIVKCAIDNRLQANTDVVFIVINILHKKNVNLTTIYVI